ncbi:unnamed protein product [Sphenostylis stenocarpa]|uniref:Protein kinase domain-containing protein n=1 Tax=Sphenostylis stenocarpa TaxID=92480 RepID=A0AA86SJS7_9FABA|nr:unnamed protein product [Sphenostylis stenocarpa]
MSNGLHKDLYTVYTNSNIVYDFTTYNSISHAQNKFINIDFHYREKLPLVFFKFTICSYQPLSRSCSTQSLSSSRRKVLVGALRLRKVAWIEGGANSIGLVELFICGVKKTQKRRNQSKDWQLVGFGLFFFIHIPTVQYAQTSILAFQPFNLSPLLALYTHHHGSSIVRHNPSIVDTTIILPPRQEGPMTLFNVYERHIEQIFMEWTRGHMLGRGSTAAVYIAMSCSSDRVFAVKSAELHRSEFLRREEMILSTLKCPQIVAYQGCDTTFENGAYLFNMFMEYAPHGTLAERGGGMDEAMVGSYTRQILQGLQYLHSNGIVHCDVKGQNVLVTEQGVKIADLGCARRVGEPSAIAGTPAFMAPEVARGEQQGFPADVWALGCTVLEMITGKPPWHGSGDPAAVVYRIGFFEELPEIPSFVSEQGRDFLGKCLKRDPNERWSVEDLLGHGFVKECMELKLFSLDSDTPTSVLERGFWDTLETSQQGARDCPSPRDRIRRLFSDEPLWVWNNDDDNNDEQWVTVRSNEVHEGLSLPKTDSTFCNMVSDEENGSVSFCEPETVVSTVVTLGRWNAINCDDCYLRGRNSEFCCRESLLSVCVCPVIVLHGKFYSQDMGVLILSCTAFLFFSLSLSLIPLCLDGLNTFHFHQYNIIWDNVCAT